jgi:hypothetical protein
MPKNPAAYREASQPHESYDAATEAMTDFLKEVGELRLKHRLANVVTIIQANALDEDGEEGETAAMHSYGDQLRVEGLCAFGYGQAIRDRQTSIGRLLKGGK